MKKLVLFPVLLCTILLSAQTEREFKSADGSVYVTCKYNANSNLILGIERVQTKRLIERDTVIAVGMHDAKEMFLHVNPADTALFVHLEGQRYYVYSTVSDMTSGAFRPIMECLYKKVRYPAEARRRSVSGTVVLDLLLDEFGSKLDVQVKTNIGSGLEEATVAAVNACSLEGASFAGVPVKTLWSMPMSFRLQ